MKVGFGSQFTPLIFEILSKQTVTAQVSIMDLEFVSKDLSGTTPSLGPWPSIPKQIQSNSNPTTILYL